MKITLAILLSLLCICIRAEDKTFVGTGTNWMTFRYSYVVGDNRVLPVQPIVMKKMLEHNHSTTAAGLGVGAREIGGIVLYPLPKWRQFTNNPAVPQLRIQKGEIVLRR